MHEFVQLLKKKSELSITLFGIVLVTSIGILDYTTSQLLYVPFYLVVVALVSWVGGFRAGAVIAIISTIIQIEGPWIRGRHAGPWIQSWNAAVRLGMLVFTAWIMAKLKGLTVELEARVKQRTSDLEREVAERKHVEAILRQRDTILNALLNAVQESLLLVDQEGVVEVANKTVAQRLGVPLDKLVGRKVYDFLPSDIAPNREAQVRQAFRERRPIRFEDLRAGRHIENFLYPVIDSTGNATHVAIFALDITERKQIEEALRQSEEKFRMMADQSPVMIGVTDENGNITFLNKVWLEFRGKTLEEESGWSWAEGMHPEDRDRVVNAMKAAIDREEDYHLEYRIQDRFGNYHWILDTATPLRDKDGRKRGYVGTAIDITEQKLALEKLKQSEQRYRTLAESALDAIYILDSDLKVEFANTRAASLFGRAPEQLIGCRQRDLFPEQMAQHHESVIRRVFQTGNPANAEELQPFPVGTIWMATQLVPLLDDNGNVQSVMGVSRDITRHRQLERQILEISDREQARIGQDIHDGLCQTLITAAFDTNLLAERLARKGLSAEADRAQRLGALLDEAISEARSVSRGLFPVKLETDGLVSALEELAKAATKRSKVSCRTICPNPIVIRDNTFATHLYRIAQEAVNNAIKHAKARHISICLTSTYNQLELSIGDDGVGIPPEDTRAIGMGLHIMAYRARVIGGTLTVQQRDGGGGTMVSCCVPLKAN